MQDSPQEPTPTSSDSDVYGGGIIASSLTPEDIRAAAAESGDDLYPPIQQRRFFYLMLVGAFWLTFGRMILGAGGWGTAIMIFTLLPFMIIYGLVISSVFGFRNKQNGYVISKRLKRVINILAIAMLVMGLTLIDGGDTRDSMGSVLTKLFGVNGQNGGDSLLMNLSSVVGTVSYGIVLLSMLAVFILAPIEKRNTSRV